MNMMPRIWITQKGKTLQYLTDDDIKCYGCGVPDKNSVYYLINDWGRKQSTIKMFCIKCIETQNIKLYGERREWKILAKVEQIPADAIPYLPRPVQCSDGKEMSVFDAAKIKSEQTIDRAYKYHEQIRNQMHYKKQFDIEQKRNKELLDARIKELDAPIKKQDEGLAILDGLFKASNEGQIEDKKVKQIKDDRPED